MTSPQRPRRALIPAAPPTATDYPPLSVCRGYLDALGLFTVAFGAYAVVAAIGCAHLLGAPDSAWRHGWNLNAVSVAGAALWSLKILWLTRPRTRTSPNARARWGWLVMLVLVGWTAGWAIVQIRSFALPAEVWDIAYTLACGGLCMLLAHRRRLSVPQFGLAPRWAANRRGRGQAVAVAVIAIAGNCATTPASAWVIRLLPWLPVGPPPQTVIHGLQLGVHLTASSVIEEMVMVAGLVTALEASRRPAWQIYAIGLAMRVSIHLYYGPTALVELIFGAIHLWLYRRTRRLTPLILAHIAFDAFASFGGQPAAVSIYLIGSLSLIYLAIAAVFIARSPGQPDARTRSQQSTNGRAQCSAPIRVSND